MYLLTWSNQSNHLEVRASTGVMGIPYINHNSLSFETVKDAKNYAKALLDMFPNGQVFNIQLYRRMASVHHKDAYDTRTEN